jgi:hypothetical protein
MQNKERIVKAAKEKRHLSYKGQSITLAAEFSTQTLTQGGHKKSYFRP